MSKQYDKNFDNSRYQAQIKLSVDQDDFAIVEKYSQCCNCSMNEAMNEAMNDLFAYVIRIIKNRLKYHLDQKSVSMVIEHIAKENKVNLREIRKHRYLYRQLVEISKDYCDHRYEYTPWERSYWYDILITLLHINNEMKIKNKTIVN